jgi:CheY-like chemotaxis protein
MRTDNTHSAGLTADNVLASCRDVSIRAAADVFSSAASVGDGRGLGLKRCFALSNRRASRTKRPSSALGDGAMSHGYLRMKAMEQGRDAGHDGHRVLVVDDNRLVRERVVTLLEGRGFSARGVGNGREALQTLRDGFQACLILLDLTMPIMDGWRFRTLQQQDPTLAEIPIVVLTALTDPAKAALKLGAVAGLGKPLDLERVVQLVSSHCPRNPSNRC